MTEQEKRENVIKGLKCCAHEPIGDCNHCPYNKSTPHCDIPMMLDAIALLEAQKPIKPLYSWEKYGDTLSHCPSCERTLPYESIYGKSNYCYKCGQMIKWK